MHRLHLTLPCTPEDRRTLTARGEWRCICCSDSDRDGLESRLRLHLGFLPSTCVSFSLNTTLFFFFCFYTLAFFSSFSSSFLSSLSPSPLFPFLPSRQARAIVIITKKEEMHALHGKKPLVSHSPSPFTGEIDR